MKGIIQDFVLAANCALQVMRNRKMEKNKNMDSHVSMQLGIIMINK